MPMPKLTVAGEAEIEIEIEIEIELQLVLVCHTSHAHAKTDCKRVPHETREIEIEIEIEMEMEIEIEVPHEMHTMFDVCVAPLSLSLSPSYNVCVRYAIRWVCSCKMTFAHARAPCTCSATSNMKF